MASVEPWPKRDEAPNSDQIEKGAINDLMHRLLEQAHVDDAERNLTAVSEPHEEVSQPRRNADTAMDIIDHAARTFEILITRIQQLEQEHHDAMESAETQAHEAMVSIDQWKRLASGLKSQVEMADRLTTALKAKFEAAETRAKELESRLEIVEKSSSRAAERATLAEDLSTRLQDKVVAMFGIGSPVHTVFEAITARPLQH